MIVKQYEWIILLHFKDFVLSCRLSNLFLFGCSVVHCIHLFVTPWTAVRQSSLSFIISWSLLKLMSIESVMPSNPLILCQPLLLLPSIFPSISVFSNELALHIRRPKYWSFSFSLSISPPMNIYGWFLLGLTGLISLLSKGTLKKDSLF